MLDLVQMKAGQFTRALCSLKPMSIRSVCVYCGSGPRADLKYRIAADHLGRGLAQAGIRLIYRGLPTGLMDFVIQAALDEGGQVTGIVSAAAAGRLPALQRGHRVMVVRDGQASQQDVFDAADAFVALPGGLETLAELLGHCDARNLERISKPVVLVDLGGFWQPLLRLVESMELDGFGQRSADYEVCETVADTLALLRSETAMASHLARGPGPSLETAPGWTFVAQRDDEQPSDKGYDLYELN